MKLSLKFFLLFVLTACQKILQQRLGTPMASIPSTNIGMTRPTTPNHYSTLGRHFGSTTQSPAVTGGAATGAGHYPGAVSGFSSSSLPGSASVVAGSTLGPAGAAIGTGHSSLAGYTSNSNSNGPVTGLGGSAINLHSSTSTPNATTVGLNTNGALAARGITMIGICTQTPNKVSKQNVVFIYFYSGDASSSNARLLRQSFP